MSWNSAALPERPTLFIDRCAWSRALGEALDAAQIPYVAHHQRFAPAAPDDEWLAGVANQGWLIVTRDQRIRYKVNEQAAVVRARLWMFVLTQGGLTAAETGKILVDAYPAMVRLAGKHRPPAFFSLHRSGKVKPLRLGGE